MAKKAVNTITHSETIEGSGRRDTPPAEVSDVIENDKLTDEEQLFCVVYVKCFNVRKAYQTAFGEENEQVAERCGRNVLKRKEVQAEVKRLKKLRFAKAFVDEEDVLQKHIDIAFADITDFVVFDGDQIALRNSDNVDGTVVSEIRFGKTGTTVRMVDKQKSLEWLSQHYGQMDEERKARVAKLQEEVKLLKDRDDYETGVVMIPAVADVKPPKKKKEKK